MEMEGKGPTHYPPSSENSNIMPSLFLLFTFFLGFSLLLYLYTKLWLNPKIIREKLRCQGISGPKPSLFVGNILQMKRLQKEAKKQPRDELSGAHFVGDYTSVIFPHLILWRKAYGQLFLYSIGTTPILHITEPDLVKAVSHCTVFELGRPELIIKARKSLFGEKGIIMSSGELWTHERKMLQQEFFMHRVKPMVNIIIGSANTLTEAWNKILQNEGEKTEIMVQSHLRNFSANIISRVCFGDSYRKCEEVFSNLSQLQTAISKASLFTSIPGTRYLPTKTNREIHRLNQEICSLIQNIVQEHKQQDSPNRDILYSIIEGSASIPEQTASVEEFIIDNCKTIYFAAFETTAVATTWCLLLLAVHPEWQDRVRKEILDVTCGAAPDFDMLRHLKMLTMVIQETLRLIPPASLIFREAMLDMKLQNIHIPKGTVIQISIPMLHRDVDLWGPDAEVFNPNRFANGISGACKYPHMYAPFGFGPRNCAGQNLAMVELKIVLSLLLMRFSFDLSPNYVHSPSYRLTVGPEHDLPLIVKKYDVLANT
ncbi:Cytochrome P450 714C2 [Rhynchospora pubera]|uniref:Cytochrome P450 714C2 n=1 Tax=Rhynchospora pubera TaxID=906938 RepID=A0AAV8F3M7_9POAL|nr:Cytochrome P450 714C2 [Rhynchospora pubera]